MGRAAALLTLLLAAAAPARAADPPQGRPDWCRPGYVCQATTIDADQEATLLEREARIVTLEAELARLRKRAGAWRWFLGPGLNLTLESVRNEPSGAYSLETHVGPGGCAGFGLTW